jgi:hypothetical protein
LTSLSAQIKLTKNMHLQMISKLFLRDSYLKNCKKQQGTATTHYSKLLTLIKMAFSILKILLQFYYLKPIYNYVKISTRPSKWKRWPWILKFHRVVRYYLCWLKSPFGFIWSLRFMGRSSKLRLSWRNVEILVLWISLNALISLTLTI